MEKHSTKNLVEELASRVGVHKVEVPPHEPYQITVDGHTEHRTGPAIILVVED